MLWINKIIKLPAGEKNSISQFDHLTVSTAGSPEMVASMNEQISAIVCALSSEFQSHRHELQIFLEPCALGPTHKKVRKAKKIFYLHPEWQYLSYGALYATSQRFAIPPTKCE